MNNEKKAPVLTLEMLAPYLPYALKINVYDKLGNLIFKEAELNYSSLDRIGHIKPILIPLSALTVEFFKENIDDDIVDFLINCEPENNHFSVEVCDKVIGWTAISYEEYQLFFKNHFDVFGLIEKGLAIDINSIEGKETNS